MKTVILMRHAKADNDIDNDKARQLKPNGRTDAALMASALQKLDIMPQIIVSSDALRAQQTAEIVADTIAFGKEGIRYEKFIYDGYTSGQMVDYINQFDNEADTALIVGHNPEIGMFAINLTNASLFHFPPATTVAIDFDVDTWDKVESRCGAIRLFTYPKNEKKNK